jgi:hypothetical protein
MLFLLIERSKLIYIYIWTRDAEYCSCFITNTNGFLKSRKTYVVLHDEKISYLQNHNDKD